MLEEFFKVGDGTGPRQAAADYAVYLAQAREFTVTGAHIALLRRASVAWCALEPYGAPAIDPNRPYGNSAIFQDIAEITEPDKFRGAWNEETVSWPEYTDANEERFLRLHVETMMALRIVLATGEFKPGRYVRQRFGPWQYAGPVPA